MSKMKEVAKILGVELEEEFMVIEQKSKSIGMYKYYFTEEGLFSDTMTIGSRYPSVLEELLSGKLEIYRKTYIKDFLEKFSDADFHNICPRNVYRSLKCDNDCYKKNCWSELMK